MLKSIVSALSIFALVFVQTAHAATWTNGLSIEEVNSRKAAAIAELEEFSEVAKSLWENIDRTQFDIDELLDSFDYDAEQIIEFVESDIFYEPYVGTLRGMLGTLLGRAGNSLDQSVLLASMLRDAGYEARISQFKLDASSAELLVDSTQIERSLPEHVFKDGTSVAGLVEGKFPELVAVRDAELESYKAEVDETFAYILEALNENGIEIGDENFRANLISDAQDYFAVEYRETTSEGWELVHPAAADLFGVGFDFAASQNFEDAVPANLQHQFRFSVRMRANTGGEAPTDTTLFSWTRPTSNLTGVDLEFTIIPLNTDAVRDALSELFKQGAFAQEDYLRVLAETQNLEDQVFVPIWNGAPAEGALAFDLSGTVVPLEASMQQASALFRTLGGAVGDAQSALSGLGTDEDFEVKTESVWIEYGFFDPGGEWEVHEREIYASDPVREVWEARADVYTLTGTYSFMLSMGEMNKAYLLQNYLSSVLSENAIMQGVLKLLPEPKIEQLASVSEAHKDAFNMRSNILRLIANFDYPFYSGETRVYKPNPSLVVLGKSFHRDPSAETVRISLFVDIVENSRRAISSNGGALVHDPTTSMKVGIWESVLEGVMTMNYAQQFGGSVKTNSSAFQILRDSVVLGGGSVVLTSNGIFDPESIGSAASDAHVPFGDLAPNEVALWAEERSANGEFAYWNIDATQGTALAIGTGNQGQSIVEYVGALIIGPGAAFAVVSIAIIIWAALAQATCTVALFSSNQELSNHEISYKCGNVRAKLIREYFSIDDIKRDTDRLLRYVYLLLHRRYG